MKKNILIVLVILLILVLVGAGIYFLTRNSEEDTTAKTVDINAVGQTFANSAPFNELTAMDITADTLGTVFGINTENVENVVGKMPMINVQASMYVLIQAKEGTAETVKAELDKYATQYEEQWRTYLPEQYALVQNRKMGVVGNTVYMIIAENAETLEQEITK